METNKLKEIYVNQVTNTWDKETKEKYIYEVEHNGLQIGNRFNVANLLLPEVKMGLLKT